VSYVECAIKPPCYVVPPVEVVAAEFPGADATVITSDNNK
jgi:hypothetical protein